MAEASQNYKTLDTRTRIKLVNRIFKLIRNDYSVKIEQIFGTLQPEQRIKVLNTSINGFIPLSVAIKHSKIEISLYLLKLSLLQGSSKMVGVWRNCRHPFIAAIYAGNSKLIEMILQHIPNINYKISGHYTPLLLAIILGNLMAVKLIVAMGADINRPCPYGKTPLMYSTFNSEICCFLIGEGANIFPKDFWGYTALHFAVGNKQKESVTQLVNAGADVRARSREGITPLIWSILRENHEAFDYLVEHHAYSTLDRIEALEITDACGQFQPNSWGMALVLRKMTNLPKKNLVPAQAILDFAIEFTTEIELQYLQRNPLARSFQCILIVEKVLGKNNRYYILFLLQAVLVAKKVNNIQKVRQLIDYIEEHCAGKPVCFVAAYLVFCKELFSEIVKHSDETDFFRSGGFNLFKMVAEAAWKMWCLFKNCVYANPFIVHSTYSDIVDTFLYLTSITKTLISSKEQLCEYKYVVTRIVGKDLRVKLLQSVLHRAIKLFSKTSWGSVELVKTLLESGADPNSRDYFRRTPIMYALKHVPQDKIESVISLLDEYGSHLDCRDSEGFRAIDEAPWRSYIVLQKPLSLQCLVTAAILDNEIPYEGILTGEPEKFVNFHK